MNNSFKDWYNNPEIQTVFQDIPEVLVQQIWDAGKLSALHTFADLIERKLLVVNHL